MMRWLLVPLFLATLLWPGHSIATGPCPGRQAEMGEWFLVTGSQVNLAVADTAVALTVPDAAEAAQIVVNATNGIRWRSDGATNAPTTANGMLTTATGTVWVCGRTAMTQFRMIRDGTTSTNVNVEYWSWN